jgi:predicted enzyme related to lactoylglutathione lyase
LYGRLYDSEVRTANIRRVCSLAITRLADCAAGDGDSGRHFWPDLGRQQQNPPIGSIVWQDLTVDNAEEIKQFYCDIIGWQAMPQNMGEYQDFNIITPGNGETVAGICHARGDNANLPAQWLIYITVEDADQSAQRCVALGGKIIDGPRAIGDQRFCIIQDPAGAVLALISG